MKIQSISIVIPTKRCVNDCPFCVSKMHDNNYENNFDPAQWEKRIKFAVNNGVNSCILTGTGEAFQNKNFLENLAKLFKIMNHPFPNVEIQTTGVFLNKSQEFICDDSGELTRGYQNLSLLKKLGVNTISLSVFNIFDDEFNMEMQGTPKHLQFKLKELIDLLKSKGFNIRLSINMSKIYDYKLTEEIFNRLKELEINQVTFRKLYNSGKKCPENKWISNNNCRKQTLDLIERFIVDNGTPLYSLPYGPKVYSFNGMSTVLDHDCMSKNNNETLKYVIIRENGKLYCRWDDEGSLIF